jgi:hypothetical protein
MSNSNRAQMRTSLGLDEQTFNQIIETYNAGAIFVGDDFANVVPDTLNKYEEEILRLRAANERLRNKNRNYRTGMKALQRAHEASLHREAAQRDTIDSIVRGGVCQIIEVEDDILDLPVERQAELAKSV